MCFPIVGSRCHSASVIPLICSVEITCIVTFVSKRKTVQEAWVGRGDLELKRVISSPSELHFHSGMLPNDHEGMSVSALLNPGMCTGVSWHDCLMLRRKASARTSCAITLDFLEAILVTQLTVG